MVAAVAVVRVADRCSAASAKAVLAGIIVMRSTFCPLQMEAMEAQSPAIP